MKTLYLECGMGAAGDMLTAALYELLSPEQQEDFLQKMNSLGLPGVSVKAEPSVKCGIQGTHMSVTVSGEEEISDDVHEHHHHEEHEHHHHDGEHEHHHHHEEHEHHHHDEEHHHHHDEGEHHHHHDGEHGHHHHHHTSLHDIRHLTEHFPVSDQVKENVLAVYGLIAQAESRAHGCPVEEIHFHEVGSMDAVADITGVCLLMEMIAPERVAVSPVQVGSGHVHCAHGILPVPAPATAFLLEGIPSYGGSIKGELCTPTGAALLRHFADSFGNMPVMAVQKIGYGMGKKDFEAANCVRAMLGNAGDDSMDEIVELSCNLDDMTPEAIGFAQEMLWEAGALDVFTTAIGMKKNRPGIMLTCLCGKGQEEVIAACMFRHTSTLGIRQNRCTRYTMSRRNHAVDTEFGTVSVKESSGYGMLRRKAEYEDIVRICREKGLTIDQVKARLSL